MSFGYMLVLRINAKQIEFFIVLLPFFFWWCPEVLPENLYLNSVDKNRQHATVQGP